ncbi:ribonuclease R [Marinagarivorans cellulosilyticus]|uniref:Ribonuclease R n=1 Tax=Marinagarivorans cellulosilyticus TaxID=2721545 RepID=A0AAN1WIF4_9GAMM|nr:ribonuclease R [Marinagarivorans cellulosilyticus]BCD98188.1 ribonuclease R [Marinagarivorans cellulosilyticus]
MTKHSNLKKSKSAINSADYEKYDNPIPSREFLLETINNSKAVINRDQLAALLNLNSDEQQEALRRRLRAMERDGQVSYSREKGYAPVDPADIFTGTIIGHKEGFGFFKQAGVERDLFVPRHQMRRVFDGDTVQARISGLNQQGREEIAILDIVTRGKSQITGQLKYAGARYYVQPENSRILHEIVVEEDQLSSAKPDQLVVVEIIQYPTFKQAATGRITQVLGDRDDAGIEITLALNNHEISHQWPQNVLADAQKLGGAVSEKDKKHRIDLRKKAFVTIDGDDAKDFDDAVYCEPLASGGWTLMVAIADVSHYVNSGSALDKEAYNRGTSVYFPGMVVPMLPEAISNGLCSLNPEVDRLVMVCEMTINAAGKMTDHCFFEGVIHSHARLTYDQVNTMLNAAGSDAGKQLIQRFSTLIDNIHDLNNLYQCLSTARGQRGAIDFETQEVKFSFTEARKIAAIHPVVRNDAHKLIEECMLCANVATALFLKKHTPFLSKHALPALFRIHEGPQAKKLVSMREFLSSKALTLGGGEKPTPKHYATLLNSIKGRQDTSAIQTIMLRSLSQAQYSADNLGHFGLAYPAYAHFTSPIRRYPDLLVHRAIRAVIRSTPKTPSLGTKLKRVFGLGRSHVRLANDAKGAAKPQKTHFTEAEFADIGNHCSLLSRRADKASWDVEAALKCHYMLDKVGEEYTATVNGVMHFGLFVDLAETKIEGLIHITAMDDDYYHFDAASQKLTGERHQNSYEIGDSIRVKVARVDMENHKVEFVLAQTANKKAPRKPRARKGAKR